MSIPDDEFLEILINDLRNEVVSYQTFILNIQKEIRDKIVKKIRKHKMEMNMQIEVIAELENELRSMDENELNFVCEKIPYLKIFTQKGSLLFFLK